MGSKRVQEKYKLVCTEGTGHFYTKMRNRRTHKEKLELKRYNPVLRRHVLYKEVNKLK